MVTYIEVLFNNAKVITDLKLLSTNSVTAKGPLEAGFGHFGDEKWSVYNTPGR